jgi:hypothetical protein
LHEEELELSTGLIPVKPATKGFTEHKDLSQFFYLKKNSCDAHWVSWKKIEKKLVGISKRLANSRGTITLAKVPFGYTKKIKKVQVYNKMILNLGLGYLANYLG